MVSREGVWRHDVVQEGGGGGGFGNMSGGGGGGVCRQNISLCWGGGGGGGGGRDMNMSWGVVDINKSFSSDSFIYCPAGLLLECMVNNGIAH